MYREKTRSVFTRVTLLMLAALVLSISTMVGPAAGTAFAQEDPKAPEHFDKCQTEKFNKLPLSAREGIADEELPEEQITALKSAAGLKDIKCGGNKYKKPYEEIAEEENPEKQQEGIDKQQEDNNVGEDDGGPGVIGGIAIGAFKAVGGWMIEGVGGWAEGNSKKMAEQFTSGRYQTTTPNSELLELYDKIVDFAKPAVVALLLLLGVSMTLRSSNYNTTYAAQQGIPKIITVFAGMAFFPEIVTMLTQLSQSIVNQMIDQQTLEEGMTRVAEGNLLRPVGWTAIMWVIKFVLNLLLIISVVMKNFLFGLLFVVGPLAMILYAVPNLSEVAAAWLKGMVACLIIPILWALEFGIGYHFVANPEMIFGDSWLADWTPFLLSLGIVYIAYKTPWKVFEWAFYSYTSGGGGSGGKIALVALLKAIKK